MFEKPFRRKPVHDNAYFYNLITYILITYIHQNPQKHRFVDDFRDWPFTSYRSILLNGKTNLARNELLDWFDGKVLFEETHLETIDLDLDL